MRGLVDTARGKETDVHIAARLVADAYENRFDRAILITADSDLAPALNIIKAAFPKRNYSLWHPQGATTTPAV